MSPRERRMDREAARQKLAAAVVSPEVERAQREAVLRERAIQLAAPLVAPEQRDTWVEVISFQRAGRRYAIESMFVVEVAKCGHLSRVPGAQPGLLGVTNLRGDLLPVFDLAGTGVVVRKSTAARAGRVGARLRHLGRRRRGREPADAPLAD